MIFDNIRISSVSVWIRRGPPRTLRLGAARRVLGVICSRMKTWHFLFRLATGKRTQHVPFVRDLPTTLTHPKWHRGVPRDPMKGNKSAKDMTDKHPTTYRSRVAPPKGRRGYRPKIFKQGADRHISISSVNVSVTFLLLECVFFPLCTITSICLPCYMNNIDFGQK